MSELVKNLKPQDVVIIPNVKGVLTIKHIEYDYNNYNTYVVTFYGIEEVTLLNGDTEVSLLS